MLCETCHDRRGRRGEIVPLSEDEERILSEIEQGLYAEDPALAHQVGRTTLYRHALRSIRIAGLGFVVGLAVLIGGLATQVWISFLGFVAMLVALLSIFENLQKIGRAGLADVSGNLGVNGLRDVFGTTGQRMRDKFRRED
jgi:hypothetical protein